MGDERTELDADPEIEPHTWRPLSADEVDSMVSYPRTRTTTDERESGSLRTCEREPTMMSFEDRLFELLPDPDEVGESEYRAVYEQVQAAVETANIGGDDVRAMVLAMCDQLREAVTTVENTITDDIYEQS